MPARTDTIEALEGDRWPTPASYPSGLVERCHVLRKVPLDELTVEDLRLLLGQQVGVHVILPLAVAVVRDEPLAEGHMGPGDLLGALVRLPDVVWVLHADLAQDVRRAAQRVNRRDLDRGRALDVGRFLWRTYGLGPGWAATLRP